MSGAVGFLRILARRLGSAAGAALLAALLMPQVVGSVRDRRGSETDVRLLQLASQLALQRERSGAWPCHWLGRSSQVELGSATCLPGAPARDAWGGPILAVYQRPTSRIPGAEQGVVALISPGADGTVSTSRRRAVEGRAAGDDLVHVVTRQAG
jgi:type II secretory pathway pseudopilin PulG